MKAEIPGSQGIPTAGQGWRIHVGKVWGEQASGPVILVPDYQQGFVAAIQESDWKGSSQAATIGDLEGELEDPPASDREDLLRRRAAAIVRSSLSGGRLTIPREVVWILRINNDERDVTVALVGSAIEIWPTQRWQHHLAGGLFHEQ